MEHGVEKRNVALIEKCVMSGEGVRSLLQVNNSTSCRLEIFSEQGAAYYRIIQMHENQRPDNWHVQAIIYS